VASEPKARVLVVDDQQFFRSLVQKALADAGYEVRSVRSAAAALALLEREGPVDIAIVELLLPGGGEELVTALRRRWPQQEVIVATGAADVRGAVAALHAGAIDYLVKPVDLGQLAAAVRRALAQRSERAGQDRLIRENLELMARSSLLERAVMLPSLNSSDEIAAGLLELLCDAARTPTGALWQADPASGFRLVAVRSTSGEAAALASGPALSSEAARELAAGRPVARDPAQLLVPCAREGELTGVACLWESPDHPIGPGERGLCARIGAIGAVALELAAAQAAGEESFRDSSTGLPARPFLDEVARVEVRKAQRFGRRLSLVCAELDAEAPRAPDAAPRIAEALRTALRGTDVLVAEEGRRFWVLVTDTDALGGVVLKRRIGQRIRNCLREAGIFVPVALGAATFPADGEQPEELIRVALARVGDERNSLAHELGIDPETSLVEIAERLLEHAIWMPGDFVGEAAALLVSELTCRPWDRGLLFLAPGADRKAVLEPLARLGDLETATEVYVATDGETLPSAALLTALSLPPGLPPDTTWLLRFGEGPPYALVGGQPRRDGTRPIFHCSDPVLVEHLTFRLRAEIGLGVRN
jgi:DNA-binding response OmpR family regulator/GGDEF domain-containing protein